MKQIHSRFYFGFTGKILTMNDEQMKIDLECFHDYNTKPEEFYTADVLSLLKSSNVDDIEKAKEMIKVRTDNDFYFQCHIMTYLYNMKICYLGIQSANENDLYFDSIIFPNDMPKSDSSENPFFLSSRVTVTFLTYTPPPPIDGYCHTIPTRKSLVISSFLHLENHLEVKIEELLLVYQKGFPT